VNAPESGLRQQLRDAFKARALVYLAVYEELAAELGTGRAEELLKRAIYKRGLAIGKRFAQFSPGDFQALRDAFIAFVPDNGRLFDPEVRRCDGEGLDIKLRACPLKEAWQEAGLDDAKVETLCRIAGVIDVGTFDAAGFSLEPATWKPGESGCCLLRIRRAA
jgi:hypothetical protein